MDTTQLQALIGTLAVLGLLTLVALPAIIGVVHDRRVDRQLRAAERRAAAVDGCHQERYARGDAREVSSRRMARAA